MPASFNVKFTNQHAWHAQITADYDYGRVRLAYTRYSAPIDFKATIENFTIQSSTSVDYQIFSAEYNEQKWSLTSEMFMAEVKPDVPGYSMDHPQGIYLQASVKPESRWDGFICYDYSVLDEADRSGEKFAVNPNKNFTNQPAFARYAKDYSLGMGFHPNNNWLIRAEYHNVQGTSWMTARDLKKSQAQTEYWNLAALSVSWRF